MNQLSDKYINAALIYYYRVASKEVLKFNSKQMVEKQTVMKEGVLLSKGRIIDGMNFLETADMVDTLNLGSLCLKTMIPVIDRYSPLAYSIAQHFHWTVANHKGMESCLRYSLGHVHILKGMSLFRELALECIRCKMKRGKFIKVSTGPLADRQLLIAPPFYACQIDLCGPTRVFVPGHEKETRATKVKESQVYIFVAVCLVTSNVNIQVCEMKDTQAMLEAFIRLSCEVGYPKYVSIDQEGSLMAQMNEIQVNLRDLSHSLYSEHGTILEISAVGGHDQHGKVERAIRSIQDSLDDMGIKNMRLHTMGLQTMCKQVENSYNNLPLGFRYSRDQDNTEILKMIVPNMLKVGRINSRALDGPVRLSNDNRKMLSDIQDKFAAWYRIWCDVYVPKLMHQKKGFKNERDLVQGDLVYFQRSEGALAGPWMIGRVDQLVRSRDGLIRRILVKYRNNKENFDRITERSARKLIKIWSADDPDLHADLSKLQSRIDELQGFLGGGVLGEGEVASLGAFNDVVEVPAQDNGEKCRCCCQEHCQVTFHNLYGTKAYFHPVEVLEGFQLESDDIEEIDKENEVQTEEESSETDNITALIMGVGVDFS